MAQSHASRNKISDGDRQSAREVDPTAYLEGDGLTCKRSTGGNISVRRGGDEVYRINEKDGHWVACDQYGNGIGDNIALVQHNEPGTTFRDAVYRLHGAPGMQPLLPRTSTTKPKQPFAMPAQMPVDQARGREYLKERGIDQQTLMEAEKSGFLRYTDKGVLFVGRDPLGKEMAATRRGTEKDDAVPKREIEGSDKRFVAVLEGAGDRAYIVDGGVDALALHTIAKRYNLPTPTVYVTGGVGNRSWLDRESMQAKLRRHSEVLIAGENEKNPKVQESTDNDRNETRVRIESITRKSVEISTPAAHFKDVADMNMDEAINERAAAVERERAAEAVKAIKAEQIRRVTAIDRWKGLNDPIASVLAYSTANGLKAAGGDPDKVDWQAVEDAATHHLIVKYNRSPGSIAAGIIKHSPGRADPATHDQVRTHVAEVAPAMMQDRDVPDIGDEDRVIVR